MQRFALACLMTLAACGPGAPQDSSTSTDSDGTSTTTSSTSTTTSSTSATQTTDAPTTSSTTTEASTTTDGLESTTTDATSSTSSTTSTSESTTSDSGTTGEAGPCCIAPDEPTSTVQAVTPVGARALPWAVYSISGGECGGARYLYLYPDASGVDTQYPDLPFTDYIEISISTYMDMWPNDFIGTGPASILAHFDGQSANTEGEITVLEYNGFSENTLWCDPEEIPVIRDTHISFTIALAAEGWEIAGEVVANYCPALNSICP